VPVTSPRIALVWSFLERYVNVVLSLGSSMIIARLLTPTEVGKFSLCAAALSVAATMRDFGISEYILQEKDLTQARLRAAFAVAITTAWPIGLGVLLGRQWIADYYAEPELAGIIGILSINFLILPFATSAFALLNREMAFRKVFYIQTSATVVQAVGGVLLAMLGHGARSLAWASVAGIAMQVLACTAARPRSSLIWPSFRGAASVLRYGSMAVTGRVIDTAAGNAHEFIIARLFGFADLGLFSRAMGLIEIFSKNVTSAIARVATPAMANAHRDQRHLAEWFATGTAIYTAVAWPFFACVAVAAPEILQIVFGPQWAGAAGPATLLAISMFPSSLYALSASALAAMGQVQRRLLISIQFSPVHVAALLAAALLGGFRAIALAWCLTHGVLLVLHSRQLRQAMGTPLARLYAPCAASAVLAVATGASQLGTVLLCRSQGWPAFVTLAAALAVGLAVWAATVQAISHPIKAEWLRLCAGIRSRLKR
jgi:O-antigen/teichoic acid export membrane protein